MVKPTIQVTFAAIDSQKVCIYVYTRFYFQLIQYSLELFGSTFRAIFPCLTHMTRGSPRLQSLPRVLFLCSLWVSHECTQIAVWPAVFGQSIWVVLAFGVPHFLMAVCFAVLHKAINKNLETDRRIQTQPLTGTPQTHLARASGKHRRRQGRLIRHGKR